MTDETQQQTVAPAPASSNYTLLEAPVTKDQARPALEQLRAERIAGRVSEPDYLRRSDYLARLDAGEQVEAPKLYLTQGEQFTQQLDEIMAPPASPYHYAFQGVEDEWIGPAMHEMGVPVQVGNAVIDSILKTSRMLEGSDAVRVEKFTNDGASYLRSQWGDQFDERIEKIDSMLDQAAKKYPQLRKLMDDAPILLADPMIALQLWRVIEHRERKR